MKFYGITMLVLTFETTLISTLRTQKPQKSNYVINHILLKLVYRTK
jgi:hypothetical protein